MKVGRLLNLGMGLTAGYRFCQCVEEADQTWAWGRTEPWRFCESGEATKPGLRADRALEGLRKWGGF